MPSRFGGSRGYFVEVGVPARGRVRYILRRHPLPISAHFEFVLVLTYAFPSDLLRPLLSPALQLDTYEGSGFLAIAVVQTRGLRPSFLPRQLGQDFFLVGYRIFARYQTQAGRRLRGLKILRSDADRRSMVLLGNLLTHYGYRQARAGGRVDDGRLTVAVRTPEAEADLDVVARIAVAAAGQPAGSPFPDLATARRFAGPLPFTFDYERETHALVRVEGVRQRREPQLVEVQVREASFLGRPPFSQAGAPQLASAFHLHDVPYRWKPGVREAIHASEEER